MASAIQTTYKVKKGDTLWAIANEYNTTVSALSQLNNISNPNYIVVGQVLRLVGPAVTETKNNTSSAIIKNFGLQSNTDRTVYATWTWDKSNTENYLAIWYYDTGDGVWFIGSDSTVDDKQCTYSAPNNAKRVKFKVKPIAKKHKVNGKDTAYWTASWSTAKTYSFSSNPPTTPPVPTVTMADYTLTARVDNLDSNATSIKFQVVKNDSTSVYASGTATVKTRSASYSCKVAAGNNYKVRCCAVRGTLVSDWSAYSGTLTTMPSAPTKIKECRAYSETSVFLSWEEVKNAETYDIEYTTDKTKFDISSQTTKQEGIETTKYEVTGLETGSEYFFRVRASNSEGKSSWSPISSTTIGKAPSAPTTWSSTTTAVVGDSLTLYWVHNSHDNSSQTYAELEIIIGGETNTHTIQNSTDEEEKDKTSFYVIDTANMTEGTQIQWRVRTAGVTLAYGDWSIQRTIDVYAPPSLEMYLSPDDSSSLDILERFPFYMYASAYPKTQTPIGYHVAIIANESYETFDIFGNVKVVGEGDEVYSKYFDLDDRLLVEFSANNLDLENNISYTAICTVSMNSGLTASSSQEFTVAWMESAYEPNAEIAIDPDIFSASIRPYCEAYKSTVYEVVYDSANETYSVTGTVLSLSDVIGGAEVEEAIAETGEQVYRTINSSEETIYYCYVQDEEVSVIDDVLLSVYRREFDGRFTELAKGIRNGSNTYITDPHPALDYARYRIVAIQENTGAVSYYDIPGHPTGGKCVVMQWDEQWTSIDTDNEDEFEKPSWAGSILKLPYNIDVSDNNSPDVELVKYIGRKNPVSYYGTQLGSTSTWNVAIDKTDSDILYALRRLAVWPGDVYVREPSGSGYWANVTVSFSQKHRSTTIPITFNITRVEGGV